MKKKINHQDSKAPRRVSMMDQAFLAERLWIAHTAADKLLRALRDLRGKSPSPSASSASLR